MSKTINPRFVALCAGAAAIALLSFGSFYTIDQGERGVILHNGLAVSTAEPGLHFKIPFFESVVKVPVTQQVTYWTCVAGTQCSAEERAEMQAYSQDQQPAAMRVTVSWHVPASDALKLYSEYGNLDNLEGRLIARHAPQDVKTVFGKYTAVSVIQNRAQFNADVQKEVEAGMDGPVQIDSVQVENIDFSDAYEKSVEARMTAQVEVQKLEQQRQQQEVQAKITVINAQAAADAQLAEATAKAKAVQVAGDAQATAIKAIGEAEASALRAKGDALRDNPNIIELTKAEKWSGNLPTTMVPGSAVPFIEVDKK